MFSPGTITSHPRSPEHSLNLTKKLTTAKYGPSTARTTQPDFSQRMDTVFFKRHVDEWKTRIKTQIQGYLKESPTGQALADLIHKEQKILAKEVRRLQDKAWKARKRASERREHRNKNQNLLLKRISLNLVIRKVPGSIPAENTSPQIHMDLST